MITKEITSIDDITDVSSTTEVFVKDNGKFGTVLFDTLAQFSSYLTTTFATKVDKISGKGLSTEDYTTAEKTKLSGIEESATKVTIATDTDGNYVFTYNE